MQDEVLTCTTASWFRRQVSGCGIVDGLLGSRLGHLAPLPGAPQMDGGQAISEVQPLLYWKGKLLSCPVHRTYSGETTHEKLRPWEAC